MDSDDATAQVSVAGVTVDASITALADDPVFSTITDLTILEDTAGSDTTGTARTVETVLSSFFSDLDSDTFGGIGVANDASTATEGTWEYSFDGTTWSTLPTVTTSTALALSKDDYLRFNPTAEYNNTSAEAALTVHALDSSYTGGYSTSSGNITVDVTTSSGTDGVDESGQSFGVNLSLIHI